MNMLSRQHRELLYHRDHAEYCRKNLRLLDLGVIISDKRRWWNCYWSMYTFLRQHRAEGETALVVGSGRGDDAILLTRLGYRVTAFDLSRDMVELAQGIATLQGLDIDYRVMAAENPDLPSGHFGLILVRDILHHVEVFQALAEIVRMAKPNALVVINEIYTHSLIQGIRNSRWIQDVIYPLMVSFIYKGEKPYITADEAKLNERDLQACQRILEDGEIRYFNMFVTRIIPDSHRIMARLDRLLLMILNPLGFWLSGRFLLIGKIRNPQNNG